MLTKEQREKFDIDPAISFCYDYILPIDEDRVLATHGGEVSLITKNGDMVCTYDNIIVPTYSVGCTEVYDYDMDMLRYEAITEYEDDVLIVIQDGLYGLIDYNGEVVLDPKYSSIHFEGPGEIAISLDER